MDKLTITKRRQLALLFSLCLVFLPLIVVAESCDYEREMEFEVPTENIERLFIRSEQGALRVRGRTSSDSIVVRGRLCAERERDLDDLGIDHVVRGQRLEVRTQIPDNDSFLWRSHFSYIDLDVTVPAGFALEVIDGSGLIEISNTGDTQVEDGSGAIKLLDIAGNVSIEDGSGSIDVENIAGTVIVLDGSGDVATRHTGSVTIEDGSGAIKIEDVRGVNEIDDGDGSTKIVSIGGKGDARDRSGSITINDHAGSVVVRDGSGQIDIVNVAGDVDIVEDGSGAIDIRLVGKSVEIGLDGSGSVNIDSVGGELRILNKGSGNIAYYDVNGEIFLPRLLR